ncbi:MAG: hypothetical protein M1829_001800 [Trizodia sp. TS-e1964]|nr:MAG: hypothetical protein M1829_001800 [Trizodia sp. TS-e1964]
MAPNSWTFKKPKPITVPPPSQVPSTAESFSPIYSPPPSPFIDRPEPLSPEVAAELRNACAGILQQFKPLAQAYEDIARSQPPRRPRTAAELGSSAAKIETYSSHSKRHRRKASDPLVDEQRRRKAEEAQRYKHIPVNAATSFQRTASTADRENRPARTDFSNEPENGAKPSAACAITLSAMPRHANLHLLDTNLAVEKPPRTAGTGPDSYDTSPSTSRTNTSSNRLSRSTGVTTIPSGGYTPAEPALPSDSLDRSNSGAKPGEGRTPISEQVLCDYEKAFRADLEAKEWMARTLSRRRAEAEARESRPASRGAGSRIAQYIRPPSRGAGETRGRSASQSSVIPSRSNSMTRAAVKFADYIKPRASIDSMRPEECPESTGSWWNTHTRRRGSSTSRSVSRSGHEVEHEFEAQTPELNLNRALPPLPSLDSWKDPKPIHIAQLMVETSPARPKTSPVNSRSEPRPSLPKIQTEFPPRRQEKKPETTATNSKKKPVVTVTEKQAELAPKKSRGLLKQLSRLHFGRSKKVQEEGRGDLSIAA